MNSVIIVAAGEGKRMGLPISKQFLEINDKTILEHTVAAFANSGLLDEVIIVLSKGYFVEGEKLQANHTNIKLCLGGKERYHSVKNALQIVHQNTELILVHDAVRPFITKELIQDCLLKTKEKGSAIPAIPLKDSIRKIQWNTNDKEVYLENSISVERADYRSVQTPQTFNYKKLLKAYNEPYRKSFTDDASVYEANGETIALIKGDPLNIKITTPEDLEIAKIRFANSNA